MKINNQTVLITGGASGIGAYIAQNISKIAKNTLVIDKDSENLNSLVKNNENIITYCCDLLDYTSLKNIVDSIYRDFKVSVVINNAGLIHSEPLINLLSSEDNKHNIDTWSNTIHSNLTTTFYVSSCFASKMVAHRIQGLIINMSSISAKGNVGQSAYSAAKSGVNSLTTVWSKELGMFGIRSAAIAPGFIETPSTRKALNKKQLEDWLSKIPLQRLGKLDEVLSAITFIIENDYFNGNVLELDGGLRI